jgi:hypothetical protein
LYTIRPITITDAMLVTTDVPETDSTDGEWAVGIAYHDGDTVRVTTSGVHNVYECLTNVTGGSSPEVDVLAAVPKWLDTGKTNRWKPFDKVVNSQSSQATSSTWVLKPGLIDAISVLNMEATDVQIVLADQDQNLVTNGTDWTGATGTTQPNSWDKVGTPSAYLIDAGALKITADAVNEGISQTFAVVAETEYQLLGIYRNTAGDIAQYAVRDMTNSADIKATTDLASSTVDAPISYVFTTPAGCISVKISLMAKANGDIVWFDTVSVAPTVYNLSTDLVSTINVVDSYTYWFEPIIWATSITKLNLAAAGLPPYPNATVTVTVTNTGGTAKCGVIVVGLKLEIGSLQLGVQPGLESFSTLTENATFGTWSVTKRASRKTLTGQLFIKNTILDFILNQMALYESELLVWVGYETYECLTVYGIYRQFKPTIQGPTHTIVDLEVRGVI